MGSLTIMEFKVWLTGVFLSYSPYLLVLLLHDCFLHFSVGKIDYIGWKRN